jgi:hypothetical protein
MIQYVLCCVRLSCLIFVMLFSVEFPGSQISPVTHYSVMPYISVPKMATSHRHRRKKCGIKIKITTQYLITALIRLGMLSYKL